MLNLFILISPLVRLKFILLVKLLIVRLPLVALPVKSFTFSISISPLVEDTSRELPSFNSIFPLVEAILPLSNVVSLISPLVVLIFPF